MQYRGVLVAATTVAVVLSVAFASATAAGPTRAAATTFDSIQVDGIATLNGTITNDLTGKPVTFGDDVRINGRVYRGAKAGPRADGKSFIINDHAQVEGDLNIDGKLKSTGSTLILKDNARITGNLALLGSLSDPEGTLTLADNTRVNGNLTVTGAINPGRIDAIYEYNRCVLYIDEFETNPSIDTMLFCWDLWVGTNLDGSMTAGDPLALPSALSPDAGQGSTEYDAKVRAEMDRAAETR